MTLVKEHKAVDYLRGIFSVILRSECKVINILHVSLRRLAFM